MPKYIKKSDSIIDANAATPLRRALKYLNTSGSPKIKAIDICFYTSGNIGLFFRFSSEKQADKFLELLSLKIHNDAKKYFDLSDSIRYDSRHDGFHCVIFIDSGKHYLFEVMLAAHELDSFDAETKKEIESELKIEFYPIKDLMDLADVNFPKALIIAERLGGDLLYQLGKHCENIYSDDPQKVVDCYSKVSRDDVHFGEVNDKLFHYLLRINPKELNKYDALHLMEQKFQATLYSGNTSLSDQLFHELCGYKDLSPRVKNIKGDTETLIALALQIRALQQQVNGLESVQSSGSGVAVAGLFSESGSREYSAEPANAEKFGARH